MTLPPQGYYDGDHDNDTTESLLQENGVDDYDEDVESDPKLQIENTITMAGMRKEARQILTLAIPMSATRLLVAISRIMSVFFIGRMTSADSLAGASLATSMSRVTGFTLVRMNNDNQHLGLNTEDLPCLLKHCLQYSNLNTDDIIRARTEYNGRTSIWYV